MKYYIYTISYIDQLIGLVGRVFANGPGDLGSIPGRVIPKTLKMVLDTSLLNAQKYKEGIKGKVEQCRKKSSALPYTIEKGAFWSPSTTVANFTDIIRRFQQLIYLLQTLTKTFGPWNNYGIWCINTISWLHDRLWFIWK